MNKILAIFFTGALLAIIAIQMILSIKFDIEVGDRLKRAADANTIEIAVAELNDALYQIRLRGDTTGYTSVLYESPDEDIKFWYNNILNSYNELKNLPDNSTSLEKSNMLMKLRETLLDNGDNGTYVTLPQGISKHPQNGIFMFNNWVFFILTISFWGLFFKENY
jgi:hypothetical protein